MALGGGGKLKYLDVCPMCALDIGNERGGIQRTDFDGPQAQALLMQARAYVAQKRAAVEPKKHRTEEEVTVDFVAEIKRVAALHPTTVIELTTQNLCLMVGQLQLAMRHPKNDGESAQEMRLLCEHVIKIFREVYCAPTIAEVLEMGFDPNCDVRI